MTERYSQDLMTGKIKAPRFVVIKVYLMNNNMETILFGKKYYIKSLEMETAMA